LDDQTASGLAVAFFVARHFLLSGGFWGSRCALSPSFFLG
jgi:hypothetical protein